MKRYGQDTSDAINALVNQGVDSLAVIIRHSARLYDTENIENEPFMGLSDEGKEFACTFGKHLPTDSLLRLFSARAGRCIETAYNIDKGHISKGGKTVTNKILEKLRTFFINDARKAYEIIWERGSEKCLRDWINGDIPNDILADAKTSADSLLKLLIDTLQEVAKDHIDILVSHDFNLYLLKEYFLGLMVEDVGSVQYLEGVIVFKKNGEFYIMNHQTGPKRLELPVA